MDGKKTYVVAVLMIVYAIAGYFLGNLDTNAAGTVLLQGLGLAALRHGISNK